MIETTTQLVHFDDARKELALASRMDEVKQIRDKAEALRQYIRQQGASLEMQNQAAEIKIRAERKVGEMLGEMEKNKGAATPSHDVSALPKLHDLDISHKQSFKSKCSLPDTVRGLELNLQKEAIMPIEGVSGIRRLPRLSAPVDES